MICMDIVGMPIQMENRGDAILVGSNDLKRKPSNFS